MSQPDSSQVRHAFDYYKIELKGSATIRMIINHAQETRNWTGE
jgi:hypothetical protein